MQRGVALAVLLWMIAALSVMAAGIVLMARIDVRLAQIQVREVQAAALGDGVAHLLLRDMARLQREGLYAQRGIVTGIYQLGERQIQVRAVPISGLIDINQAGPLLWVDLLQYRAGLTEENAVALAEKIIAWRAPLAQEQQGMPLQRRGRFEVLEDLMLVEGFTREILEGIRPAAHSYQGNIGIDLTSAPAEVLLVLARGDKELVERFMAERAENPWVSWDGYPGLTPEHLAGGGSALFRIDARILQTDGKVLQRSRWVQTGSAGRDQLPWRRLRGEPVIAVDTFDFLTVEETHGAW